MAASVITSISEEERSALVAAIRRYREEVSDRDFEFRPYLCSEQCPCRKRSGEPTAPTSVYSTGPFRRYIRSLTAIFRAAAMPVSPAEILSNPWILPHSWQPGAEDDGPAYITETAGAILRQAYGKGTLPGCDPVLKLVSQLGAFPSQAYLTPEKSGAGLVGGPAWVGWEEALLALQTVTSEFSWPFAAVLVPRAGSCHSMGILRSSGGWELLPLPADNPLIRVGKASREPTANPSGVPLSRFPESTEAAASAGEIGEKMVHEALLGAAAADFGQARVRTTSYRPRSGDFVVQTRVGAVLVEAKNYTRAVPAKEVEKLVRDLETTGAAAALLVSVGSGVVGVTGACSVRMVPAMGYLKPLIILSPSGFGLEGDGLTSSLPSACSLGLATAVLLAAEHARTSQGCRALEEGEALAAQLEAVNDTLGQAAASVRKSLSVVGEAQQETLSSLAASRALIAASVGDVRASLCGTSREVSDCASWEGMVQALGGGAISEAGAVRQIWAILSEADTDSGNRNQKPWTVTNTGKSRSATISVTAGGLPEQEITFRFLQASTHLMIPMQILLARGVVAEVVQDRSLQKELRIANDLLDVKITEATLPSLSALISKD